MVKTMPASENELLQTALESARQLGVDIQIERDVAQAHGTHHIDALARITWNKRDVVYAVEIRPTLHPAALGAALQRLERPARKVLLVTDYVGPALADELKRRHIAFLDTAGNAYLADGPLLIWVKGQKRPARTSLPAPGRAFQPTGLQVVFTLLCKPEAINLPYRELARLAGVAHGTVGWVMPDLQAQGFVDDLDGKRGTRRLFQAERLVNQWADAYARVLRPRLLLGRYHVPGIADWKEWPLREHDVQWGGEAAGAVLTDYLHPGELTLYAAKMPALLAARMKFLKEAEPGHKAVVEVRHRFWNFAGEPAHPDLVPPLLVYADLLATGDARCIETAQLIYDLHIVRLFDKN